MLRRLLMLSAALAPLACGSGTPTSPAGSTLAISADPSAIGSSGRSAIRVFGRKPDGNPMAPGTEIRLSTNLGVIPALMVLGDRGEASAYLEADGRIGLATVKAALAAGTVTTETGVQIGALQTDRPTLVLNADPNSVAVRGSSTVSVLVRNADRSPREGAKVLAFTTLGTIGPQSSVTGADGVAHLSFRAGTVSGSATVTALSGTSDPATTTIVIR